MKLIKQLVFGAMLTISAFCAVVYSSSCNKDKCKDVTCQNGGVCDGGNCTCLIGYEGTNCETKSRDKFIKSWTASDLQTGASAPLAYSATIVAGTGSDVTQVIIGNTFSDNFYTTGPITATVLDSVITIANQHPDGNKYSLSGAGHISGGKITWAYTIKNDSTNATLVYAGLWQ